MGLFLREGEEEYLWGGSPAVDVEGLGELGVCDGYPVESLGVGVFAGVGGKVSLLCEVGGDCL